MPFRPRRRAPTRCSSRNGAIGRTGETGGTGAIGTTGTTGVIGATGAISRVVMTTQPQQHGIELLVIQPTPFCNLDCSYCYLPHRSSTRRISPEVLRRTFERVFA